MKIAKSKALAIFMTVVYEKYQTYFQRNDG